MHVGTKFRFCYRVTSTYTEASICTAEVLQEPEIIGALTVFSARITDPYGVVQTTVWFSRNEQTDPWVSGYMEACIPWF